eukprot:m.256085 g.256085  ORF g.256085 m.256085 type:complete len:53 (+) comp11014_c0_seq11:455-613(+)
MVWCSFSDDCITVDELRCDRLTGLRHIKTARCFQDRVIHARRIICGCPDVHG